MFMCEQGPGRPLWPAVCPASVRWPLPLCAAQVLVHAQHGALRALRGVAWAEDCQPAAMTDVLRVHDWAYVRRVRSACLAMSDAPLATSMLDPDTALSRASFRAALKAAGAACHAVDAVVDGHVRSCYVTIIIPPVIVSCPRTPAARALLHCRSVGLFPSVSPSMLSMLPRAATSAC